MKTLLCDLDPQGNSTSGLGIDKDTEVTIYDVILGGVEAAQAIVKTKYCDLLPANRDLAGATVELVNAGEREYVLKKALSSIVEEYDYIFIDTPPSLEMLTINALCAAESILIPLQCEYYAMEGLSDLLTSLKLIRANLNPKLEVDGIVLTMYDRRTNLSTQVEAEVRGYFGELVYKTTIPRNIRIAESPSHGKPVIAYDRLSKGSRSYIQLANEFMKRQDAGFTGIELPDININLSRE